MRKQNIKSTLPRLVELEERTAALWLQIGTIAETSRGEENTYYRDQFDNQFYCKNYPRSLCSLATCQQALRDYLDKRVLDKPARPGPALVCWESQADAAPIRLSFSIKVF